MATWPDLETILGSVRRLHALLTHEFEALKAQQIDVFESLQPEKVELLQVLASSGLVNNPDAPADPEHIKKVLNDPKWGEITDLLDQCQRAHQRNELLISKQLDVIRGALSTLQNQDPAGTLELYTKLGRIKSSRRSILSGDA
mgnify:CR=1 FL=1